ncbi:hypothetical protein LR69_00333 [Geobacillus sp. BCO2]|nr:hypothetical protein LR69_00333 [Geobacillus sp. BCO2]
MKRWMIIALLFAVGLWLVPYSVPLLFALATALLLEPSIRRLQENYKLKRVHAVTAIFSLFIIILGLSLYFLVVIFVQQVMALSQKLPYVLNEATKVLDRLIQTWQSYSSSIPQEIIDSLERGVNTVEQMLLSFATNLTQSLVHYIAAIPAFLIHFLVYLIALFLLCLDLPQLKQGMRRYLSERTEQRLGMVVAQLSKAGIGFLKAQFLLSLITFFLAWAGLLLLGVDYAALMALVIVVVDILPILGTGSVLVPWGSSAWRTATIRLASGSSCCLSSSPSCAGSSSRKCFPPIWAFPPSPRSSVSIWGFSCLALSGCSSGRSLSFWLRRLPKPGSLNGRSNFNFFQITAFVDEGEKPANRRFFCLDMGKRKRVLTKRRRKKTAR